MKTVTLERFAYAPDGTFGRLIVEGFACYTLEREWVLNKAGDSCIPEGTYPLTPSHYVKGGYDCYEVTVPGRTRILVHKGNTEDDLAGCIAPGVSLACRSGKWAVAQSGVAFDGFMAAMNGDVGTLHIYQHRPAQGPA
jgi:hypothetical protein